MSRTVSNVSAAAVGQWDAVFNGLGIDVPARGKHGPCPTCGGTDRFHFDDHEGRGTWHCRHCEPHAGDGLDLVQRVSGQSITEAAQQVAGYLGITNNDNREVIELNRQRAAERKATESAATEAQQRKTAARAADIMRDAVQGQSAYLAGKGFTCTATVNSHVIKLADHMFQPGCLVVPMYDEAGQLANVQLIDGDGTRAYLPGKGTKAGRTHFIDGEGDCVALAEGYASALSVSMATGWPTYAAFDASNLPSVIEGIAKRHPGKTIVICGDHDREDQRGRRAGHHYAEKAATLVSGAVIAMPAAEGTDWDDYRQAHGNEATRAAIRACLVKTPAPANDEAPQDIHDMPPIVAWPHMSEKGRPLNTIPNLTYMLDHYGVTVRYDVIRKELVIRYPGQSGTMDNSRSVAMNTILSLASLNQLPKADAPSFVLNVGDRNPVNPVMNWITSKPWDGRSRLGELMDTLTTAPGYSRDLLALLLRRWLVSAVAAAAMPHGFHSKGVLTFQGPQSIGKTSWFKSLVGHELADLVKEGAQIDTRDKDTVISAVSNWLVELGELDATFRKSDIARLKAFVSADYDMFRRPYGRTEEKYPRKTVFFASVNAETFLVDDTGNSRWWTVPVTAVNHQHGIDMQQLWAEVYGLFKDGERWWLTRDEEQQLEGANDDHRQVSPIEELVRSKYDTSKPATRQLTASEVLIELGYDRPARAQLNEAGKALADAFGKPRKSHGRKVYDMPPKWNEPAF